jgi:hypothetical protein
VYDALVDARDGNTEIAAPWAIVDPEPVWRLPGDGLSLTTPVVAAGGPV